MSDRRELLSLIFLYSVLGPYSSYHFFGGLAIICDITGRPSRQEYLGF